MRMLVSAVIGETREVMQKARNEKKDKRMAETSAQTKGEVTATTSAAG